MDGSKIIPFPQRPGRTPAQGINLAASRELDRILYSLEWLDQARYALLARKRSLEKHIHRRAAWPGR